MPLVTPLRTLILATLLAAAPSSASNWAENGDAGELPSGHQTTIGVGPLTSISGTIEGNGDRDLFCIRVVDQLAFSASLSCLSSAGLDLWLFSTTGLGIAHDDGCAFGLTRITGTFKPGVGSFLLGVSAEGGIARNFQGLAIWNAPTVSGERAPDGPGAPGPITSWVPQSGGPANTPYTVQLQGCVPCDAVVSAPAHSWGTLKSRYR